MLAVGKHDRVSALPRPPQALEREVGRLCAARGEDDLDRLAVEHVREPLARLLEQAARLLTRPVDRRRVAEDAGGFDPRVSRLLAQGRGRGVIEVAHPSTLSPRRGRVAVTDSSRGLVTVDPMALTDPAPVAPSTAELLSPDLDRLGVTLHDGVGTIRVWSAHADAVELVVFDPTDLDWITDTVPLRLVGGGVWEGTTPLLRPGVRYAVRVSGPPGPGNVFNRRTLLLEPYSRGLQSAGFEDWRSVVVDGAFDWGGVAKPAIPLDRTVVYEGHVKGLTKRHPSVPPALHGTYAGLAHPAMIDHFVALGVTSIELLPVHAFASEPRLPPARARELLGLQHDQLLHTARAYATEAARREGPEAVLREFKGMVRLLHEAGLEVILDVVYNHTSEEGIGGPRTSLRGLDNRAYYRQQDDGTYIDVTGCGNSLDTATPAAARLVLDSLRYWANDVQIDGFRFDLAATLGRDGQHAFTPEHPLLRAIQDDPALAGVKKIAEPWDVGMGGWQTGNFGAGWLEWNDRYRDRVRNFWLSDIDYGRTRLRAPRRHRRLRQPARGLGEHLQRGARAPREPQLRDGARRLHAQRPRVLRRQAQSRQRGAQPRRGRHEPLVQPRRRGAHRRPRCARDAPQGDAQSPRDAAALGGRPDADGGRRVRPRTQRGNNNAYCHDSPLTWLKWEHEPWQRDLFAHVQRLIQLRRDNPALRPSRFERQGRPTPSASDMDWYDENGETMSIERWTDPSHRTLQYVAASTPETEAFNRILLIVHGIERQADVRLPTIPGVTRYVSLWCSADETPDRAAEEHAPGTIVPMIATSMHLFRAE